MTTAVRSNRHVGAPGPGDWKETLGRVGLVGKGVLFVVVGILALQLATGGAASEEASMGGAIEWIGSQPLGKVLLVALTLSLFAMAAWRALDAWLGDPVEGSEAKERVKFAVEAVIYLALGVAALSSTISNWSGEASQSGAGGPSGEQKATATVFEWPAGRWLVVLAGVAAVLGALYVVKKHVIDEEFLERLDAGGHRWVEPAGRIGYGARAVIAVLVGWFLVQAGLQYDPNEAKGLSAVLQELTTEGWGKALLWLIAVGLLATGLFSMAEAKLRRAA